MTKFNNLKKGEVLSETQFYTVEKVQGDRVQLSTDAGKPVVVSSQYVEELLNSADQFVDTKKVTRTEIIEKFLSSTRVALTVNFNKKVNEADIKKSIVDLYPNTGGKMMSKADFEKAVKTALNLKGEERTMTGRHNGVQDTNGRVSFVDMKITKGNRQRLVDPRTINWLIVDNVKYVVK